MDSGGPPHLSAQPSSAGKRESPDGSRFIQSNKAAEKEPVYFDAGLSPVCPLGGRMGAAGEIGKVHRPAASHGLRKSMGDTLRETKKRARLQN